MSKPTDARAERLRPFLSRSAIRFLESIDAAPSTPMEIDLDGTALWADVRGFTRMTELSDADGAAGTELLRNRINDVFELIVEAVEQFGGDVQYFAGDGLLAIFESGADRPGEDALRAATAARQILDTVNRDDGDIRVGVGLGSGAMRVCLLGGDAGRWHTVAFGDAIADAIAAEGADPTRPCCGSTTVARLGDCAEAVSLPDGWFAIARLEAPDTDTDASRSPQLPVALDAARSLIPRSVRASVLAHETEWLAETRPVSVVFAHFSQLGEDAELAELNRLVAHAQDAIHELGGSVLHAASSGTNITVLGAFGVPTCSHEDDSRRALLAADRIRDDATGLPGRIVLGVATGRALCATIGSVDRHEYTLIGDTVNLAARLMQGALSRFPANASVPVTWCDLETMQRAPRAAKYAPLPALPVKGKQEPVPLFRVGAMISGTALRQSALGEGLVGRRDEMHRLREQVERAQDGSRVVVVIEGEAGVGKSQLVAETELCLAQAGVLVWNGLGDAIERSTAYAPWRPVFAAVLGIDPELDAVSGAWAIEWWMQTFLPESIDELPLLDVVTTFDLADSPLTAGLQGKVRADRARGVLAEVLRQASRARPAMIVLEDAHWFDTATWLLIDHVLHALPDLSVMVTTRPADEPETPEGLASLLAVPGAMHLRLEPLDVADRVALAASAIGAASLPPEVAEWVSSEAEGNPYYTLELVRALRDAGAISVVDGECHVATPGGIERAELPDSLHAAVTSRIDRLEPGEALSVKVASVLGSDFRLGDLAAIHPSVPSDDRLREQLDDLCRRDLMKPLDGDQYEFTHAITHDVCASLLLQSQRRELHLRAADVFESKGGDPGVATAAYHLTAAVCLGAGLTVAQRMTETAMRVAGTNLQKDALLEAAVVLEGALDALMHLEPSAERSNLELPMTVLRAVPLTLTGGWASPEVIASYERADELCAAVNPGPQLFPTRVGVFTYHLVSGNYGDARRLAIESDELARALDDPALMVEASMDRTAVDFYTGRLHDSLANATRVRELYDPAKHFEHAFTYGKDPGAVAGAHEAMALALVGRPDEAIRTAQEAVEHSTRWFHPFTHVWMLTVLCIVRQLRDEPEEIGPVADRMVVLCNDHGFPNWLAQAMVWRGWAVAMLGEPHEGVASMRQGVDIWAMTGSQLIRPYLLGLLADGLRAGGRLDEAREAVETALAECERTGELVWHSLVLRIAADIAEASGNDPVPILRRAVAAAESTGAALHEAAARTRLDRLGSKGAVPSGRRDGGSR